MHHPDYPFRTKTPIQLPEASPAKNFQLSPPQELSLGKGSCLTQNYILNPRAAHSDLTVRWCGGDTRHSLYFEGLCQLQSFKDWLSPPLQLHHHQLFPHHVPAFLALLQVLFPRALLFKTQT